MSYRKSMAQSVADKARAAQEKRQRERRQAKLLRRAARPKEERLCSAFAEGVPVPCDRTRLLIVPVEKTIQQIRQEAVDRDIQEGTYPLGTTLTPDGRLVLPEQQEFVKRTFQIKAPEKADTFVNEEAFVPAKAPRRRAASLGFVSAAMLAAMGGVRHR